MLSTAPRRCASPLGPLKHPGGVRLILPSDTRRSDGGSSLFVVPAPSTVDAGYAWQLLMAAARAERRGAAGMQAAGSSCTTEWTLVNVCVHEAGHAVVASGLGLRTSTIEIDREPVGGGRCLISGLKHLPAPARRQIGLAGFVAGELARAGVTGHLERAVTCARGGCNDISPEDLDLMEGQASDQEIMQSARRVQARWVDIIGRATQLLQSELRYHEAKK